MTPPSPPDGALVSRHKQYAVNAKCSYHVVGAVLSPSQRDLLLRQHLPPHEGDPDSWGLFSAQVGQGTCVCVGGGGGCGNLVFYNTVILQFRVLGFRV